MKSYRVNVSSYPSDLCKCLYQLQQNRFLCDAELKCKDGTVHVHKLVLLSCGSFYFTSQISKQESTWCSIYISLDDFHSDVVHKVIQGIYTGEIIVIQNQIEEIFSLCKFLDLSIFKSAIIKTVKISGANDDTDDLDIYLRSNKGNCDEVHVPVNNNKVIPAHVLDFDVNKLTCDNNKSIRIKETCKSSSSLEINSVMPETQFTKTQKRPRFVQATKDSSNNSKEMQDARQRQRVKCSSLNDRNEGKKMKTAHQNDIVVSHLFRRSKSNDFNDLDEHDAGSDKKSNVIFSIVKNLTINKINDKKMENTMKTTSGEVNNGGKTFMEAFSCKICHNYVTRFEEEMKKHLQEHEEKNSLTAMDRQKDVKSTAKKTSYFVCEICPYRTTYKKSFTKHIKSHAEKVKPLYQEEVVPMATFLCDVCGTKLKSKYALVLHVRTHGGTQKHVCNECGSRFNQMRSLRVHIKTHDETPKQQCPTCKKLFKEQEIKTHVCSPVSDSKECFVCDDCGHVAKTKGALQEHRHGKHEERRYPCPHCDKQFAWRSSRKVHIKRCVRKTNTFLFKESINE